MKSANTLLSGKTLQELLGFHSFVIQLCHCNFAKEDAFLQWMQGTVTSL